MLTDGIEISTIRGVDVRDFGINCMEGYIKLGMNFLPVPSTNMGQVHREGKMDHFFEKNSENLETSYGENNEQLFNQFLN